MLSKKTLHIQGQMNQTFVILNLIIHGQIIPQTLIMKLTMPPNNYALYANRVYYKTIFLFLIQIFILESIFFQNAKPHEHFCFVCFPGEILSDSFIHKLLPFNIIFVCVWKFLSTFPNCVVVSFRYLNILWFHPKSKLHCFYYGKISNSFFYPTKQ